MSRNTGNRSAAPRKNGGSLLTGILIGMIIGAGMAAGLAWYIMQSPSPFKQKEPAVAAPSAPAASAASDTQPPAASGVAGGKPRFEFYKVLTDKETAATAKPAGKPQPAKPPAVDSKPLAANATYFCRPVHSPTRTTRKSSRPDSRCWASRPVSRPLPFPTRACGTACARGPIKMPTK